MQQAAATNSFTVPQPRRRDAQRACPAMRGLGAGLVFLLLTACVTPQEEARARNNEQRLENLARELAAVQANVSTTRAAVNELSGEQEAQQAETQVALEDLRKSLDKLPADVARACEPQPVEAQACSDAVQTVVVSDDKMVVGELEDVWIEPPGAYQVARIDTGASSSSIHAENVVEFERDGEDWVRFELVMDPENATVERPVTRHVRVFQQADPEGSRRPVVEFRVRLGDLEESFEFTLADRSHLDQPMLLGRNFLANTALVDVGKQFVQPRIQPQRE